MTPAHRFGLQLLFLFFVASSTAAEPNLVIGHTNKVPVLLKPERIFDAVDGKTHEGWAVLVTSNRITAVGPAAQIQVPSEAVTISLPNMTVLPGLMDIHSHIF